ncbi:SCO family protein [Streptomyces virginiae]|uniref:SCO family protein n=1 Tax=Streptomyces virginiae TaxID=1961 RepID=UPI0022586945|nr:SCO family protein [Streptomyces virginiae]MCX5275311.1 SCO family protein [Streptomyces virginiae]
MHSPSSRLRLAAAAGFLSAALLLSGCGTPSKPGADGALQKEAESAYQGTEPDRPFDKPDLRLTGTDGQPYDLRQKTAGRATLLFFGYTNCPDVCPTTLGDVSVALQRQPKEVRENIDVVFVTTDPERDTPAQLGKWLQAFGDRFTGMSGDLAEVKEAAKYLGVSVEDPTVHHDGKVTSSHGTQVLAFLPTDNKAHVIYTSGTPMESFVKDLPLLAKGATTG